MSSPSVHVETCHDLPFVSVMVGFRTGASQDPEGLEGVTRAAVRMLRRGAAGMDAAQIADAFDSMGAEYGEYVGLNAIHLSIDVIRRSLDRVVDLLCTLLGSPDFDEVELGKLLRETESEVLETRNHDRALCGRALRRVLFAGHPFSRRVSGLPESLRRIERRHVQEQHRAMLVRDNVVFAFSGDLTETEAHSIAKRICAALPEGPVSGRVREDPLPLSGRRLVFVDKPDRTQTQMLIGTLGTRASDPDHTSLLVANTVFGGAFTSRLMSEVRVKRGWSYGAYANLPIDLCREAFTVWTHPNADDAAACLALELELLETWRTRGITARELTFTKRYLSRSQAFEVDTASKRAQRKLLTRIYELPDDYYDGFLDRVKAVTVQSANLALRERLDLTALVVAVTGTFDRIGEGVAGAIPDLLETIRVPYDVE